MNVPNEELDAMLDKSRLINKHVMSVIYSIASGNTEKAVSEAWVAQKQNNLLRLRLENAGATETPTDRPDALALLSSPTAKHYAAALRECANACREMERGRGQSPSDGMTEWFELQADAAELEVFGPKELR